MTLTLRLLADTLEIYTDFMLSNELVVISVMYRSTHSVHFNIYL